MSLVNYISIDSVIYSIYKKSLLHTSEQISTQLTNYLKEYIESLVELGYIKENNMRIVLNILTSLNGLVPYSFSRIHDDTFILIDINKKDDSVLSKDEKIRLELYQKVGEYILNEFHKDNINNESNRISSRGSVDVPDIIDGFYFLNRAISQEIAEQVLTHKTGKNRFSRKINSPLIYENSLETDFHINPELEEPAKLFSGTIYNMEKSEAFFKLTYDSFNEDFINVVATLSSNKFATLLMGLGNIKRVCDKDYTCSSKSSLAMTFLESFYEDNYINKKK